MVSMLHNYFRFCVLEAQILIKMQKILVIEWWGGVVWGPPGGGGIYMHLYITLQHSAMPLINWLVKLELEKINKMPVVCSLICSK